VGFKHKSKVFAGFGSVDARKNLIKVAASAQSSDNLVLIKFVNFANLTCFYVKVDWKYSACYR
jgi:hypothetical protein